MLAERHEVQDKKSSSKPVGYNPLSLDREEKNYLIGAEPTMTATASLWQVPRFISGIFHPTLLLRRTLRERERLRRTSFTLHTFFVNR
jgi:hypothetical protein